jgi:hypothetical protein
MPLELVKELIKTKNKKGDVIFKQPTAEERKKLDKLKAERDAKKAENAKPEVSVPVIQTTAPIVKNNTTAPIKQTKAKPPVPQAKPPPKPTPPPPVPPPVPAKEETANDLTSFIKDSELLIISDFEGTTPNTQFEKFAEYATGGGTEKKVIYLGDVFDSTVALKIKESKESKEGCVQDDNYCALQSVKLLVDNPTQCKYVVGNRDLNKIKLLPFFQFKDGTKWWNPEGATSYEAIVEKLLDTVGNGEKEVWLVGGKDAAGKDTTMDFFKPFWNIGKWNTEVNITARAKKNYTNIYDRFEALFGDDGIVGTMSAINTLKSIPNEMFASLPDMTIDNFIKKLTNTNKTVDTVRAALVITLFMRMLDKDLWKEGAAEEKKKKEEKKVGEFGALDGYLYKYITEAKPAYYADYVVSEKEKNLLLFAHGGITKDFVIGKGTKATELLKDVSWNDVLLLNDSKQQGGAGNPITDSIDNFNEKYNELLTAFFDKKYEGQTTPAKLEDYTGMLTLLQLSAGFANNPKIKTTFTVEGEFKDDKLSPIQKKDASDQNLDQYIGDYNKIYNIFGHASTSTGYSFGKSKDSDKTYFINTDYSTTLFKADISCDDNDSYNENYLQLKLNTSANKLYLEGSVTLNSKYKQFFEKEKEKEKEKSKEDIFAQFLTGDKLNPATVVDSSFNYYIVGSNTEQQRKGPLTFTFPKEVNLLPFKEIETKPQFIFNGIAEIDDKKYEVYSSSYFATGFGKSNLFIFLPTGIIAGDVVEIMATTPDEKTEIVRVVQIKAPEGGAESPTVIVKNAAGVSQTISIANIKPVDPAVSNLATTALLHTELAALLPSSASSAEAEPKTPLENVAAAAVADPIYSVLNENNPTVDMTEGQAGEPIYENLDILNAAVAEEEERIKKAAAAAATAPPITEQDIEKNIEELILWKTWYRNFYKLVIDRDNLFNMGRNIRKNNKKDKSDFNAKIFNCIIKFKAIVDKNENVYYKNKIVEVLKPYEQTFNPTLKNPSSNTELINKISNYIDNIDKEVDSKFAQFKRQILNNDLRLLKNNDFITFFTDFNSRRVKNVSLNLLDNVQEIRNKEIKNFIFKKKKDFELEVKFNPDISIEEKLNEYFKGVNRKFYTNDKVVYRYIDNSDIVQCNGTIGTMALILKPNPILQYTITCDDGEVKNVFYNADITKAQRGGFIRKKNKKTKKSYYSHKDKKTIRKDKKIKHKKQTLRDKKQRKNKKTKRRRTSTILTRRGF